MSWFLLIGIAVALLVPLATRGSYLRLIELHWRWRTLLAVGVALQIVVDRVDMPFRLGLGLLVASYVLLLGFCAGNVIHRGLAVVAIGIGANFLVIAVNGGMPVRVPPDWAATGGVPSTVKHHAQDSRDHLTGLGDIIVLRALDEAISFGDLILVVGLCNLTYQASRRRVPRREARPAVPASAPPRIRPVPVVRTVRVRPRVAASRRDEPLHAGAGAATGSTGGARAHDSLERLEHA